MSRDSILWTPVARIDKYSPEVVAELTHLLGYEPKKEDFDRLGADPYASLEVEGNALTTNGLGNLTNLLTGGTTTPVISTTRGFVCVGDSSTAFAAAQTDLQAASNKYYNVIDGSGVTRVTTTVTNDTVQCVSTFGTSVGNFAWAEWAIGSSTGGTVTAGTTLAGTATGAFIYNRRVASMGTKASGASWAFTAKIQFS
jgi:hypothetical protein